MENNKVRRFILKVFKKGKEIQRGDTGKILRFVHWARLLNWQNEDLKVYMKVTNGKQKDHRGKLVEFYNDGYYTNKQDFDLAYKAFIEE